MNPFPKFAAWETQRILNLRESHGWRNFCTICAILLIGACIAES